MPKKYRTSKDLSAEELAEAKEKLHRYFDICWKIATRLQMENLEGFESAVQQARVFELLKPKKRRKFFSQKSEYPSKRKVQLIQLVFAKHGKLQNKNRLCKRFSNAVI